MLSASLEVPHILLCIYMDMTNKIPFRSIFIFIFLAAFVVVAAVVA